MKCVTDRPVIDVVIRFSRTALFGVAHLPRAVERERARAFSIFECRINFSRFLSWRLVIQRVELQTISKSQSQRNESCGFCELKYIAEDCVWCISIWWIQTEEIYDYFWINLNVICIHFKLKIQSTQTGTGTVTNYERKMNWFCVKTGVIVAKLLSKMSHTESRYALRSVPTQTHRCSSSDSNSVSRIFAQTNMAKTHLSLFQMCFCVCQCRADAITWPRVNFVCSDLNQITG